MNEQVMPKVGGKSFRCDCGCNVFTKIGEYRYECNACTARYQGEPEIKIKSLNERIEAWCASPNDVDTGTMILEASGIIFDLKADLAGFERDNADLHGENETLREFKAKVYEAYTPNSHYDPAKLEAVLINHMVWIV